jgi:hypothetical protein
VTQYAYTKGRRDRRRRFVAAVRDTCGCVDCGTRNGVLAFDHRPGEEKRFNIAQGLTYSFPALVAEVLKCDVRCASCHQRRHIKADPRRMRGLKYAGANYA